MAADEPSRADVVRAIDCADASEFLRSVSPWGPYFGGEVQQFTTLPWVFRGHGDAAWPLLPMAFRPKTELLQGELSRWHRVTRGADGAVSAWEQASAEAYTLQGFYLLADQMGLPLPENSQELRRQMLHLHEYLSGLQRDQAPWPPAQLLSLMGLAQHHGLPTRLLDWTRDVNVAAYFASLGAATEWREIESAARAGTLSPDQAARRESGQMGVWALDLHGTAGDTRSLVVSVTVPGAGNANLLAQEGLFTVDNPALFDWSARADRAPLEQRIERGAAAFTRPVLYHFRLAIGHAAHLLTMLARERVTAARFFPGYDGVVRALRERQWRVPLGAATV